MDFIQETKLSVIRSGRNIGEIEGGVFWPDKRIAGFGFSAQHLRKLADKVERTQETRRQQ